MLKRLIQLQAAEHWPVDVEVSHVTMPMTEMDIDSPVLADAELRHAARYRQSAGGYTRVRGMCRFWRRWKFKSFRKGHRPAQCRWSHGTPKRSCAPWSSSSWISDMNHQQTDRALWQLTVMKHSLTSTSGVFD